MTNARDSLSRDENTPAIFQKSMEAGRGETKSKAGGIGFEARSAQITREGRMHKFLLIFIACATSFLLLLWALNSINGGACRHSPNSPACQTR